MQIEDGAGTGRRVSVTLNNRLDVLAVTATTEHHANEEGRAYHLPFDQAPTAGGDCIIYIENSDDEDMCIEGIWLSPSGATEIYFQLGDTGTRNAATGVVPVNCNAGSGNTADGTFEVGADLDGGAATLAGGTEIERYVYRAAADSAYRNFEQDIFIPKNSTLTIWSSAIVTINGTLVFNYHEGTV